MGRRAGERRDRTAPRDAPSLRLLAHPKRGAILVAEDTEPGGRRYRGRGLDSDWHQIALIESVVENGYRRPAPTERPPKGFLWGDPERQVYGLSGPILVFGPIEKTCRDCGVPFVLTAQEQKHLAETLHLLTLVTSVRCRSCRRAKVELERTRKEYAEALAAAERAPTAEAHLAVARAALAVLASGGRAPLDKALAHCRRARKLGAAASADRVEQQIAKLRATR